MKFFKKPIGIFLYFLLQIYTWISVSWYYLEEKELYVKKKNALILEICNGQSNFYFFAFHDTRTF